MPNFRTLTFTDISRPTSRLPTGVPLPVKTLDFKCPNPVITCFKQTHA